MKKAQIQDANCINCQEAITNPICPECLAEEISQWKPELKEVLLMPEKSTYAITTCVICGKGISICAYCYCKDIFNLIKEKFPKLADEFIEKFNFGLKEELF